MLIYDVLQKDKVYNIIANDLRNCGVKYRLKKNLIQKIEKCDKNKGTVRKIFKTSLSYQPLEVVNLVSGGIVHVPIFINRALIHLKQHIHQEGLFRKAGSHLRQKELISHLDSGGSLEEKYHAIDVANCVKTFLSNLPEPLIPYEYHDLFVHCGVLKKSRVEALLLACLLLPPYHLNTLAFVMEFLKMVSSHEDKNKMSVDNLTKVIGPSIMPLQEVTRAAVQARLNAYLSIIKTLIENAEKIGLLPDSITQSTSAENTSSIGDELNASDSNNRSRRKKRRSGSLTRKPHLSASNLNLRMFNGLKKIVGKSNAILDGNLNDDQQNTSNDISLTPVKTNSTKKRKVIEKSDPLGLKKKKHSDKSDKPKKTRLSLDRLMSKSKQKIMEETSEARDSSTPCIERRWSSVSHSDMKYKYRAYNNSLYPFQRILKTHASSPEFHKTYNDLFTDADINLSDHDCELSQIDQEVVSSKSEDQIEEYIQIPKSEYEEIKNRVSALETRMSQEFACVNNRESIDSVHQVQTEYEKTLEEANIESITSADHLAKRLGKELKIRKSTENKIIRSPSARKIGNLRRRSQERVTSKRAKRAASWHIADRPNLDLIQNNYDLACSDMKTNNRLDFVDKQLNFLISHTTEHTKRSDNQNKKPKETSLRKALSFNDKEFLDKSSYFNKKVEELRKTNTQKNNSDREKTVSWKNANSYFDSGHKNVSIPQTGRASIARLRTQNAGMVLARAKLFDHPIKNFNNSDLQCTSLIRTKRTSIGENLKKNESKHLHQKNHHPNENMPSPENPFGTKSSSIHITENTTPRIKKSLTIKTPKSARSLVRNRPLVDSRRTPLKAVLQLQNNTPKHPSPRRNVQKTKTVNK